MLINFPKYIIFGERKLVCVCVVLVGAAENRNKVFNEDIKIIF